MGIGKSTPSNVNDSNISSYENQGSAPNFSLKLHHQANNNFYNQGTLLYLTESGDENNTNLYVYNTESKRKEVKILATPEPSNEYSCIVLLPNSELFCYGGSFSGIAFIIDVNYKIKVLPSGTPTNRSSGIYFNNNIYCFGGGDEINYYLPLSRKFDLDQNRWIDLTPMPANNSCHSVIFNGNILIAGINNWTLLLYSIDTNSFSELPYIFGQAKRKILIYVEKLYLIECGKDGTIYESEDEYNWRQISKSKIRNFWPDQVFYLYNKGGIYISTHEVDICKYYYFSLRHMVAL